MQARHSIAWNKVLRTPLGQWLRGVMQMIDRLDQGLISPQVVQQSYQDLWRLVSKALFRTHVEGQLKVIPAFMLMHRLPATTSRCAAWTNHGRPKMCCRKLQLAFDTALALCQDGASLHPPALRFVLETVSAARTVLPRLAWA